eukprot:3934247-Rhodomonas_salina.2
MAMETERLLLRELRESDAPSIQRAASQREIADTMISIPHPYPEGEAERFIEREKAAKDAGHSVTFVIENKTDQSFCGLVSVREIDKEHSLAELSFWVEKGQWGNGFMTEAVQKVVAFVFDERGLNRLYAYHMLRNPSCGRLLQKCGFAQEGLLRQRVFKWGVPEDVCLCALLRQDWKQKLQKP